MIIRQKTKRRLFVLVAGVMLVGAAATTAFVVRRAQVHRDFMARREQGMSAFKRGEIVGAVANLTKYVARYPKDAEALFSLASARRQFPTPDGGHLHQTIHFLRQYLDLEPTNVPARRMMLEAYLDLGYDSEAVEAANQLLAIVPDDKVGNRALIRGLFGKRDYKTARDKAEKYTKSEPSDLEIQVIMIQLYDATGQKQKILPHAVELLKQNPDDGRFELLLAVAYNMVDRWTEQDARLARELVLARNPKADVAGLDRARAARFLLEHAAKRAPSDAAYVHLAIGELDKIGLTGESLSLLQRWDAGQSDPEMRRLLVRRLWESNRFDDVDRALRAVDPTSPLIEAELVGLRAVSLASLGQKEEAARLAEVLAKRAPDPVALAWASIVQSMHLAAEPDPGACVAPIHHGLGAAIRNDAYLRYYLAEAYTQLGEYPYAIELLRKVVGRTRGNWSMPLHRLSRLMLIAGESEIAIAAADMALRRSPGTVGHAVNLLHVAATRRNTEDAGQTRALLDLAKQVRQAFPDDQQTLPVYVVLLARSGQEDEARRTLQAALDAQDPPRQAVLLQLAAASIEAKLGLEEKCFDVAEAKHGNNADLAFARAMELYQRGRGGDGMKRFEEDRARAQAPAAAADASWRLAHAKLLEVLGEQSAAAAAWSALADDPALAGNLQVQRAALNSRFAQADPQLISRAIDRVRKLTGEQAVGWRVARALWLLQAGAEGSATAANADPAQAVELLRDVVEVSLPNDAHSRVLYAAALEQTGKLREAIEQMSKAAELRPTSHMISLELARLYQADGKFELARQLIQSVAREQQRLTPQERRQLVVLLARQGNTTDALNAMQSGPGGAVEAGGTVADQLMLLELLRRQNQLSEADSLVRKLMAKQPTLQVVQVAAAYYASTRREDEAERALASLDKLQISAGERHAARARHYHAAGKPDKAVEHDRAAAAAAPENLELARGLVSSLLRTGRIADALRAAEQASGRDAGLQRLVDSATVVAAAAKDKQALSLVVAIVEEPEFAQASLDALRVVVESRDGKAAPAAVAGRLRPIADRAPRLLPLQRLLLNYHLAAGQGDAAVAVAQRCLNAAPDSPELAQLAAEVLGAAGSWHQALTAGKQWRNLSLSDTLAADQFIAQAHLRLNDPAAALKQLQPHLAAAEAAPDTHSSVLLLRARAMLMQGALAKAGDSLWPYVARAAGWRMAWLELTSALNDQGTVETWLERLSPVIPETAVAERLALANTWYVACDRLKSPALFRKAQAALEQLAARSDATADVFFGLAVIHEVQKRLPEAEVNYRKALTLNAQHAIAKNNLAMVITNQGGDLVEAMRLATEAVRAQPNLASLYDTLATIQHKSRDYRNAAANLRAAIGLEPEKLAWRLNLADVLIDSGDATSAGIVLRETEGIAAGLKDVPAEERQRLQSLRGKLSSAKGSNQAATTEP